MDLKTICQKSRDAYELHAVHLKNRHNIITFPLLILTSATAVISSIYVQKIVGVASAILTAVQCYCAYSERSENARMTAKSFGRIIRNMKSKSVTEILSEMDCAHENAKDIPWELLPETIQKVDWRLQKINSMYPIHPVARDLRCIPTEVLEEERVLELEKLRLNSMRARRSR